MALSNSQRAMVVAVCRPEPDKGGRGRKGASAFSSGFSQKRLAQARSILRFSNELADEVLSGVRSLDYALKIIQADKFLDQWIVAVHEASHAIVALALGFSVDRVTIEYTDGIRGRIFCSNKLTSERPRPANYEVDASAMVALAGACGERVLLKMRDAGGRTDHARVDELIGDKGRKARLIRMAQMLCLRHRVPILYVAKTLLTAKTLQGEHLHDWWRAVRTQHLAR